MPFDALLTAHKPELRLGALAEALVALAACEVFAPRANDF